MSTDQLTTSASTWSDAPNRVELPPDLAYPLPGLPALAHRAEEGPEGVQTMRNVGWTGFGALSMSIAVLYF